ncbi:hypothetical protein ACJEMY_25485, partial [Escherichia coli]
MSRLTRRSLFSAVSAGAAAVLLTACSEPAEETTSTSTEAAADEQVTLTVYTSEPEEKVDEINAAFME